jgi:hypothetical protein
MTTIRMALMKVITFELRGCHEADAIEFDEGCDFNF